MKITIESTTKIVKLDGIECRVWEGETASGIPILVFIPRIAVEEGRPPADYRQFDIELKEQRKPSAAVEAIPLRMIL